MKEFGYEVSRELKKFVKKRVTTYMLETSYIQAIKEIQTRAEGVYVSFIKLKPPNVRQMKALERVVCCCIKCENVIHCIQALNHFAVQHNHTQLQVPVDTIAISSITLCPDTTRNEATCLQRTCKNCGVDKLSDHFAELTANHEECIVIYGSN